MLDVPAASPMNALHPGMSMQARIYVDRCQITDTVVLSMYTADSSCRLFSVPLRELRRIAEDYERRRECGVARARVRRIAQRL
jgi:hypothetical protein